MIDKDPYQYILDLEWLQIEMTKFGLWLRITEEGFMINVLNDLPEAYDIVSNGFENRLTSSGPSALTIEIICKNLSHQFKKIKNKNEKKKQKKRQCWPMVSSVRDGTVIVASMNINMLTKMFKEQRWSQKWNIEHKNIKL